MLYSLEEIYASGGRLPIVTLTIANESIGTLRYVLGYEDMQLWGDTYEKSAFTVSMPERSDSGFSDLSFGVDGKLRQPPTSPLPNGITNTATSSLN